MSVGVSQFTLSRGGIFGHFWPVGTQFGDMPVDYFSHVNGDFWSTNPATVSKRRVALVTGAGFTSVRRLIASSISSINIEILVVVLPLPLARFLRLRPLTFDCCSCRSATLDWNLRWSTASARRSAVYSTLRLDLHLRTSSMHPHH